MRKIAVALCVVLCLLLTGCGQGPVRVVSRLSDDTVLPDVELTDGSFHFTPHTSESYVYDHPEDLEHTEWVTYTYADIVDFLQCDLIDVLTKAGVPEWCIPTPEQFFTEGYRMTADEKMRYWFDHVSRETILQAGTIYAGEGFQIAIPYEDYTWQCRKVWLNANLEGQYLNIPVSLEMRESPPTPWWAKSRSTRNTTTLMFPPLAAMRSGSSAHGSTSAATPTAC